MRPIGYGLTGLGLAVTLCTALPTGLSAQGCGVTAASPARNWVAIHAGDTRESEGLFGIEVGRVVAPSLSVALRGEQVRFGTEGLRTEGIGASVAWDLPTSVLLCLRSGVEVERIGELRAGSAPVALRIGMGSIGRTAGWQLVPFLEPGIRIRHASVAGFRDREVEPSLRAGTQVSGRRGFLEVGYTYGWTNGATSALRAGFGLRF